MARWAKMLTPALVASTLLFSACTDEVGPEYQEPNTELITPNNVLTFESGEALAQAIGQLKDGSFDATDYHQGEGLFTSMYHILEQATAEADAILAPFAGLEDADLEARGADVAAAAKMLEALEQKYQGQVIFEDHLPTRLKFKDELMAQLVNQDGLLIIGTRLFRYQNGSIQHAALSTERNAVADLLATTPSDLVQTISLDTDKAGTANRDVVVDDGCSTANGNNQFESYVQVTNTYVPITITRREWVPPVCHQDDPCPTNDCPIFCLKGHWRTITEVIGEDLTNTRIYASLKTRKRTCFIFCNTKNLDAQHNLSISGFDINESTSGFRATSTITLDLFMPRESGNVSLQASAPAYTGFLCSVTLYW